MNLPINENELGIIISALKNTNPQLYAKLWSYKFRMNNQKMDEVK